MKNTTRSAIAAAALAAAGLAVTAGAAGITSAAPRIANHEQLRAGIAAAASSVDLTTATLPGLTTGIVPTPLDPAV
jgi:hypothetical protein